jgi:hypothetical protein
MEEEKLMTLTWRFVISAYITAMILSAVGCAHIPRATVAGHLRDAWDQISTSDYLRVRGIGAAPDEITGQTKRRGFSRNAALVAARYQLLSVIKGVKLEGGVTISQLMEKDSLIREIANEVVAGGEEIQTDWLTDDGCVVTLELRRDKVERLIQRKTKHEADLEARVVNDIEEIKRLEAVLTSFASGTIARSDEDHLIEWQLIGRLEKKLGKDHVDSATLKKMVEEEIVDFRNEGDSNQARFCGKFPNSDPRCPELMDAWGVRGK